MNIMFKDLKNSVDYYIRSHTKFSRKNYKGEVNNDEAAYVFDILTRYMNPKPEGSLKILDIGSKNWAYVKVEYDFFRKYCDNLTLDGVEIDAYRLYANLYSRFEAAKFYIKNLEGVRYYADDLMNISDKYDYIIWLLPFVTPYPLEQWGLPKNYFMPQRLLEHACEILKKEMLIVNQGEQEAKIQQTLIDRTGLKYKFLGEIKSSIEIFKNPRYGFLVSK